jgi:hypothetical protein
MGARYSHELRGNLTGTRWKVTIFDRLYSGPVRELIGMGDAGIEFEYENEETDERIDPIKGSRVNFFCTIEDNSTGTNLETFLLQVLNANEEDRFEMQVDRDNVFFWYGSILHDISEWPNKSKPYKYRISAVDGIARLKQREFTFALEDNISTFVNIIYQVLKLCPIYNSSATEMFSITVAWYENQMQSVSGPTCPLRYTRIYNHAFTVIKDTNERYALTAYDVLLIICKQFNLRVQLSAGVFRFRQLSTFVDDSNTYYERFYTRATGAYSRFAEVNDEIDIDQEINIVDNSGVYTHFPPLKQVKLVYPLKQTNYLVYTRPRYLPHNANQWTLPVNQTLRDNIIGGTNKRLIFKAILSVLFPNPISNGLNILITIKLKIGPNYLRKPITSTNSTWTTDSSDRFYLFIQRPSSFYQENFTLNIITPDIPNVGGPFLGNEFSIALAGNDSLTGASYTHQSFLYNTPPPEIKYNTSATNEDEPYLEYVGQNTNAQINSYDLDLGEALFGEAFDPTYIGQLQVWDGSAWKISSGQWKFNKVGTGYDINEIRVIEVIAGQSKPVRRFQTGMFSANILPHLTFGYSLIYLLHRGVYNCKQETWNGEWFAVGYDRASYHEITSATNQSGPSDQQLFKSISDAIVEINYTRAQLYALAKERTITVTTHLLEIGNTITELRVDDTLMEAGVVLERDFIRVINPNGDDNLEFEVTADYNIGDTFISVASTLLVQEVAPGAVVAFSLNRPTLRALKLFNFPTSAPAQPNRVWVDPSEGRVLKLS